MTTSRYVPPPSRVETLDIQTSDGWSLRADVHEPEGPMAGVVVMAHALMARRSEYDKPAGAGLASFFAKRGWCAVPFDFRAHGDSGKPVHRGGHYAYDDLVRSDLPAVCAFARERAGDRLPVVVLGHSLGGHVALAAQGSGAIQVDAVVTIASALWLREFVASTREWLLKRGIMNTFDGVSRAVGRFPARTLGLGSDDVARPWIEDFQRYASTGKWASADGLTDYRRALGQVRVPVMQVVSDGDRLECPPDLGARFARACAGPVEVLRIAKRDDGGPPPGHMAIVMSSRIDSVRARIEAWMRESARVG